MKASYFLIIISVAILLGVYYSYTQHFLVAYEEEKVSAAKVFEDELIAFRSQLSVTENDIFDSIYREQNAKLTVWKHFLGIGFEYEILAPDYFECTKSVIAAVQKSNQNLMRIENLKRQLLGLFTSDYEALYNRLIDSRELVYRTRHFECNHFFPELKLVVYEPSDWNDIHAHLIKLRSVIADVELSNSSTRNELQNTIRNNIGQFRSSYQSTFRSRIERESSNLVQSSLKEYVVDVGNFSPTVLNLETTSFNVNYFNSILQQELTAQWHNNALNTGARPYTNCFPSQNSCSGPNCSEIRVINSGSDVIVTVKDRNGRVVRHAYIRGNDSFTIHLPDGTYQTFFYSGRGWNPNKPMSSSTCSQLRGGFTNNESFTKDPSFDNLRRHIITYTLTPTRSGNFNTVGSNATQNF